MMEQQRLVDAASRGQWKSRSDPAYPEGAVVYCDRCNRGDPERYVHYGSLDVCWSCVDAILSRARKPLRRSEYDEPTGYVDETSRYNEGPPGYIYEPASYREGPTGYREGPTGYVEESASYMNQRMFSPEKKPDLTLMQQDVFFPRQGQIPAPAPGPLGPQWAEVHASMPRLDETWGCVSNMNQRMFSSERNAPPGSMNQHMFSPRQQDAAGPRPEWAGNPPDFQPMRYMN